MVFENGASSSSSTVKSGQDMVNFTVLVVDDSPISQALHEINLKMFGLKDVQIVENGKEAVDLFDSGASFDLVIMDKEMPVMDGVKATKKLRAMGVSSMIIGATSCGSADDKQAFMEAGLDYCFDKPLTADKISFILQEFNKKKNNKK